MNPMPSLVEETLDGMEIGESTIQVNQMVDNSIDLGVKNPKSPNPSKIAQ